MNMNKLFFWIVCLPLFVNSQTTVLRGTVLDKESKEPAVALRNEIIQTAFESGLLLIPCGHNSIRLTPPLNIPRPLVDEGLQLFETAVTAAEANHY